MNSKVTFLLFFLVSISLVLAKPNGVQSPVGKGPVNGVSSKDFGCNGPNDHNDMPCDKRCKDSGVCID